jgi:release factor glutamine methyltransferase
MIPATKPISPVWRGIRRIQHAIVYHLFIRRALARTDVTRMFGLRITVPPSVFHPRFFRTTRFLGEYLQGVELKGRKFLEMGCGSGILSLLAARKGATVTAADINPEAVAATHANAAANRLAECVAAVESDLFSGLAMNGGFDVILWNPPFYPVDPTDHASHAWNAGAGYGVLARFARSVKDFLRPGGKLIMQVSTEIDQESVLALFEEAGLERRCVGEKRLPFETLRIYEFVPGRHER